MNQLADSNRFSRTDRLLTASQFSRVFHKPFKSTDYAFTILFVPNTVAGPRIGIVVAKKNVRLAVQRHRIKRVVRESFRTNKVSLKQNDIVVICKNTCAKLSNRTMSELLRVHWKRINQRNQ